MITWSSRRKLMYAGSFLSLLAAVGGVVFYVVSSERPTCFDGIKNQGEEAVDCGGQCTLACSNAVLPIVVRWQRIFRVGEGLYNAVAMVENPNIRLGAKDVPYLFRVYDSKGILIVERRGVVGIFPGSVFPVFEAAVPTGSRIGSRVTFEFAPNPKWVRIERKVPDVRIAELAVSQELTSPRITAMLENHEVENYRDIVVVAVVYDKEGNAMGVSRTKVDVLKKGASSPLIFTWPSPFPGPYSTIDLIPLPQEF